ncbi:MAG: hypothetical protein KGP12_07150 [Actinomycetales bacterium]|nr:hypothetical protein [Actinomycetales bacterium]
MRRWGVLGREAGWLAAAVGCAALIACWINRDAIGELAAPWSDFDIISVYALAKGLQVHGWFTPNPDLGWPYGLDLAQFPTTEIWQVLQIKALTAITASPVAAVNLLFLLGYPLAAATAYLFLRWIGIARVLACLLAIGFSSVPWHQQRFSQVFFTNYAAWPVAAFLLSVLLSQPVHLAWLRQRPRDWWAIVVTAAIIVGLSGAYLGAFFILITAICLIGSAAASRVDLRRLLLAVVVSGTVMLAFGAVLALYRLRDVTEISASPVQRSLEDSYAFGGDLASLLVPAPTTWLADHLPERLTHGLALVGAQPLYEGNAAASPLVAGCVVTAVLVALGLLIGRRHVRPALRPVVGTPWAGVLLVAMLLFAVGGLGAVFAGVFTPEIRAWGRLAIFIILVAMAITGLLLTSVLDRAGTHRRVASTVIVSLLALLVLDQATGPSRLAPDPGLRKEMTDLGRVAQAQLPAGCAIFNHPPTPFPESPTVQDMGDYSHFLAYLFVDGHPMSYGAVKGTPQSLWQLSLPRDAADLNGRLSSMGFCAILVDANGLPQEQRSMDEWKAVLGEPIAIALGRWFLFRLPDSSAGPDPSAANLGAASAMAGDVVAVPVNASSGVEAIDGSMLWWNANPRLSLGIVNLVPERRAGVLRVPVKAADCVMQPVQVSSPQALEPRLSIAAGQRRYLDIPVDLGAGASEVIEVTIVGPACRNAGDPRDLLVAIEGTTFTPSA